MNKLDVFGARRNTTVGDVVIHDDRRRVDVIRGASRHEYEKLRVVLPNMFPVVRVSSSAVEFNDTDGKYVVSVEHIEGRVMSKEFIREVSTAAWAIVETARSY